MLNLLKLKKKYKIYKSEKNISQIKKGDNVNPNRHFPPLTKSWFNSIYTYDKNVINSMPYLDIIVNKVLKMYFYLNSNVNINKKFMRRRNHERSRSANRIFLSRAEIKHSNDKVIITLYTYNKTKKIIAKTLSRLYRRIFNYIPVSNNIIKNLPVSTLFGTNKNLYSKFNIIKFIANNDFIRSNISNEFKDLKKEYRIQMLYKDHKNLFIYKYFYNLYKNMLVNKTTDYLIYSKFKIISKIGSVLFKNFILRSKHIYKVLKDKNLYHIIKLSKRNKLNFLKLKNINIDEYKNEFYNNFLKKSLKKEILYLKYNQLFMTDDYKFSNIYLLRLGNIISKIYGKKIEFNIINLKYIHLDTRILSEIMSLKIRDRKNNLMTVIKNALALQKINNSKKYRYKVKNAYINQYNVINKKNNTPFKKDALHLILKRIFNISLENYNDNISDYLAKEKYIYRSIRFRKIRGVRLEAKGRLTKRLTASKSIYKVRYRGSLKNIDTINNFPCVILRGYLNSNVDYVNLNSKTRNGSFGLKGWISSK